MLTKIALAAALAIGAATAVQAGSKDDNGGRNSGGYHIGPMGQWFGGPAFRSRYWGRHYMYDDGFAYEPRYYRYWRYER
jgi:hypothetical protein